MVMDFVAIDNVSPTTELEKTLLSSMRPTLITITITMIVDLVKYSY